MAKRPPENRTQDEVVFPSPEVRPAAEISSPKAEEIARLAHQYWLERGSPIGTPEEDWFRAEEELKLRGTSPEQEGNRD
jgi:hypothetical protein